MVLSLAPIIKESVTKPNVSLTRARTSEAQQHFRRAGNGHVSEAGEGLNRPPRNPALGPRETFLGWPHRPPHPAALPAPWLGAVGVAGAAAQGVEGQNRAGGNDGGHGQCWGGSNPSVLPPHMNQGGPW